MENGLTISHSKSISVSLLDNGSKNLGLLLLFK